MLFVARQVCDSLNFQCPDEAMWDPMTMIPVKILIPVKLFTNVILIHRTRHDAYQPTNAITGELWILNSTKASCSREAQPRKS